MTTSPRQGGFSRRSLLAMLAASCSVSACTNRPGDAAPPFTIFAAASLSDVTDAITADYRNTGEPPPRTVYAGSAQLARQIAQGAPADVFISADQEWMDWLQQRQLIQSNARRLVASNRLVLIAPARDTPTALDLTQGPMLPTEVLARLGNGRLALAEPDIPAGRYGRQALTALGLWDVVSSRLAGAENVRAALALVARGEAPLGIVYATDAMAEPNVRMVATFDADDHAPIVYPAAPILRPGADLERVRAFIDYLIGPEGQTQFQRFGFMPPP